MKEREPIFREFAKEYQKANKKEKGKILDEFVGFTGLNCIDCGTNFTCWHGHNRRKIISDEVKTKAVRDYVLTQNSLKEVAEPYGVKKSSILIWFKEVAANYSSRKEVENLDIQSSGNILIDGKN